MVQESSATKINVFQISRKPLSRYKHFGNLVNTIEDNTKRNELNDWSAEIIFSLIDCKIRNYRGNMIIFVIRWFASFISNFNHSFNFLRWTMEFSSPTKTLRYLCLQWLHTLCGTYFPIFYSSAWSKMTTKIHLMQTSNLMKLVEHNRDAFETDAHRATDKLFSEEISSVKGFWNYSRFYHDKIYEIDIYLNVYY